VVTGLGVLSPLGLDAPSHWKAALLGRSAIRAVTSFPVEGLRTRFAGQLDGFEPERVIRPADLGQMDRFSQMAVAAARLALADAGLASGEGGGDPDRIGVCIGTAQGGRIADEQAMEMYFRSDGRRTRPLAVPLVMPNAAAAWVAITFHARGPAFPIASACAAGLQSVAVATLLLRAGAADVVLAGASDAPVTRTMMVAWGAARATSTRNDAPERASRPFDKGRDGFVLAEGAAVLVLERADDAIARGARIYAEVRGHGHSADAHDIVAPDPDGSGAALAMRRALADGGATPDQIAAVSAHGTSTRLNDVAEARALRAVLDRGADKVAVTALKSMTGHAMGASGAIEAATAALCLREGKVPPNANLEEIDPDCALDHVIVSPRPLPDGLFLVNSFGFGGANACLLLARWEGR
jgi:3-oxoacyl-[acyl-carrier-protein] synthase II